MLESPALIRFVIVGQLRRDYILLPDGKTTLDSPGGNLLYCAAGLAVWEKNIGIVARVGEDYPQEWLEMLARRGIDRKGIRIQPESYDLRNFFAYPDMNTQINDNPVLQFARLGLEMPKSLLGYYNPFPGVDSHNLPLPISIRVNDIPPSYLDAGAAHLCPIDFISHHLLPSVLKQGHVTTLTIDPAPGYMNPVFWDDVHALVKGISAFLTSEAKIRSLYQGRSTDLWEMVEDLGSAGCEIVAIKRGEAGQYLYDSEKKKRWIIPAYPCRVIDPTGAGDSFCGGFLAGYYNHYDPLEAVFYGNVSASLTIEGSGPLYASNALPGLAQARLASLRDRVRSA